MSIVTTVGNVAVSCFAGFVWVGYCVSLCVCVRVRVCVCVNELSQMPGQGSRNFCGAAEVLLRRKT